MTRLMLALAVSLMICDVANAQSAAPTPDTFTATDLILACTPEAGEKDDDPSRQTCIAYLKGLTDGLFMYKFYQRKNLAGCTPTDAPIPPAEAIDIFGRFLKAHPDSAYMPASVVASYAILQTYPCYHPKN